MKSLPRYAASLFVRPLTGGPLKSAGGGVARGLASGFLQARLSRRGTQGCVSSIVVSGAVGCRPILVDLLILEATTHLHYAPPETS